MIKYRRKDDCVRVWQYSLSKDGTKNMAALFNVLGRKL